MKTQEAVLWLVSGIAIMLGAVLAMSNDLFEVGVALELLFIVYAVFFYRWRRKIVRAHASIQEKK